MPRGLFFGRRRTDDRDRANSLNISSSLVGGEPGSLRSVVRRLSSVVREAQINPYRAATHTVPRCQAPVMISSPHERSAAKRYAGRPLPDIARVKTRAHPGYAFRRLSGKIDAAASIHSCARRASTQRARAA
jgi:hypothetical protein